MVSFTTIQIPKNVLEVLKKSKEHPRQTYSELILSMAKTFEEVKKYRQYDKFLHEIQKQKMQELWDNSEDEEWENA